MSYIIREGPFLKGPAAFLAIIKKLKTVKMPSVLNRPL